MFRLEVILRKIQLSGYRNLAKQQVVFNDEINLFIGNNGQGKTNALEAIHFLANLKSFRSSSVRDIISHKEENAEIYGTVIHSGAPINLKVVIETEGRRLWLGNRQIYNAKDYLGNLKVVAFTPEDLSMIKGSPSQRRRFIDRAVFLSRPDHLRQVREFNTALRSRNQLLKQTQKIDWDQIDSFSQKMAEFGNWVSRARNELIEKIVNIAGNIFSEIVGTSDGLRIKFRPGWDMQSKNKSTLLDQLRSNIQNDLKRKQTIFGPQQDDFEVLINSKSAKRFSSQGQQRLATFSLIMAVVSQLIDVEVEKPVVLLDDVSSELDYSKRELLFKKVLQLGTQLMVTTTDEKLLTGLSSRSNSKFRVEAGLLVQER